MLQAVLSPLTSGSSEPVLHITILASITALDEVAIHLITSLL